MSESTDRREPRLDDALVEQLLGAVREPAVVCDRDGAVRAWNDAFAAELDGSAVFEDSGATIDDSPTQTDSTAIGGTTSPRGAPFEQVVDCGDERPVATAIESGEPATGTGALSGDGNARWAVESEPLTRDGTVVGAVATLTESVAPGDPIGDRPGRLAAILESLPVVVVAVDAAERVDFYQGCDLEGFTVDPDEVVGAPMDAFADEFPDLVAGCRRALDGERSDGVVTAGDRTLTARFRPLTEDGTVTGALAVAVDISERIANEERLEAINRRLDLALRNTDAGAFEWQFGDDEVYWHDTLSELMGYEPDANYRTKEAFRDLVHPEDLERHVAAQEAAIEDGGEFSVEFRVDHPEKGERWMVTEGEVEYDEDGEPERIVGIDRDVTERKEREQALERTNRRLDRALEGTGAGVFEWQIGDDEVYWHETTSRLYGLDPETTVRSPDAFQERLHPDDAAETIARVDEAIETGGDVSVEYRIVRPDGEVRWLETEADVEYDEDGEPVRLIGIVRDVTDRKEREQQLREREAKLRAVIRSSGDPIVMKDTDGAYQVVNEAAVEALGLDREEILGSTPNEVFDAESAVTAVENTQQVLDAEETRTFEERIALPDGERTFRMTRAPFYGPDDEIRGTVTVARDVTEQRRRREELATLAEIQELIHENISALAAATTATEVRRTVCERLADSPFYEFAWIGRRDASNREVEPAYAAGDGADFLDEITVTVDASEHGQGPTGAAYRTGEGQVVDDVRDDPAVESWRDAALDRDFESVTAVPLTHGSTTHGVLTVYADRPDAFSERERAGFEVLGEAVGFALSAAQNRRLLESENVLELEFETRSDVTAFVPASAEHDCRFVFDHAVHTGDGSIIYYLTVEDADPSVAASIAEEADNVESVRRLEGDGPDFEVKVSNSVYQCLADVGARGKQTVAEDGVGRIFVDVPGSVDVRQVSEVMQTRFSDAELVAKRGSAAGDAHWWRTGRDVGEQLTDRQRSVLQAAYYSGYYEWPRETDAEALADSLDVASTTLLQHLRKGHGRVLEAMFDA